MPSYWKSPSKRERELESARNAISALETIGDEQDAEIESLQATIDVRNIERDNLNDVITYLRSVIEDHERTIDNLLCEVSDLRQ